MTSTPTPPLSDLSGRQVSWIAGDLVMTLATMPGQTPFIAQFNAALRGEFGLSNGAFGGPCTLATLTSATGLVFAGVLADRITPLKLASLLVWLDKEMAWLAPRQGTPTARPPRSTSASPSSTASMHSAPPRSSAAPDVGGERGQSRLESPATTPVCA
ncbi:hypothetical protein C8J28_12723 [Cereibacter azotoformans]|uniref:MFS transporter n=1 Tax=Cereibacter azotoformans TaxID=43057 RepID=A0A2T5JSK8_9RHOB|nr:hypothetical protein C8J28_12723 [Cereibacter azotoformans]